MKQIAEIILAFLSILGLLLTDGINIIWSILIALVGIVCIVMLSFDYYKDKQTNKIICTSDEEIKTQMKKIIKTPGKVGIMSRDLSWVDVEVEACIKEKAKSMLIFAEDPSPLTQRLELAGVEMRYYGVFGFEPKTRFTIIRYNTNKPQVAIANTEHSIRKRGKVKHTIYQTSTQGREDEWINSLTSDMLDLCRKACEKNKK